MCFLRFWAYRTRFASAAGRRARSALSTARRASVVDLQACIRVANAECTVGARNGCVCALLLRKSEEKMSVKVFGC